MKNYKAGVVIPVYMTDFIADTINYLKDTTNPEEHVFCIVNDGVPKVKEYLSTLSIPDNMYVLNLPKNLCFAGSNNAGFRLLLEKHPNLEFLGSLNDDTIPKENWLEELITTINRDKNIAAVAPQLKALTPHTGEEFHSASVFTYGPHCSMLCPKSFVDEDTYVNLFGGCCFLCRTEAFKEVHFFDEEFQNGAEDLDLCLKFLTLGYKLMVSSKSHVVHFGGKSRLTRPEQNAEICHSVDLLFRKWGHDLTKFNSL